MLHYRISSTILSLFIAYCFFSSRAEASSVKIIIASSKGGRKAAKLSKTASIEIEKLLKEKNVEAASLNGRKAKKLLRKCLRKKRCIKKLGRRYEVDLLLTAEVRRKGRRYTVSFRLLSADSGKTVSKAHVRGKTRAIALAKLTEAAKKLVLDQVGEKSPAPQETMEKPPVETSASSDPVKQVYDTEDP